MHTGVRRTSPSLSESDKEAREWANMIWNVDKTPMHGFLRVSPTTRDIVRYRSVYLTSCILFKVQPLLTISFYSTKRLPGSTEWNTHHRVLLVDTADNLYFTAIQQCNFVDPLALVISGFRTQSYKPVSAEMNLRSVCDGIVQVKHRRDKYHCTMRVFFATAEACTDAIRFLNDSITRKKVSHLGKSASKGIVMLCVLFDCDYLVWEFTQ